MCFRPGGEGPPSRGSLASSAVDNDSCGVEADTNYNDTDRCWGPLRRVDVYHIYLVSGRAPAPQLAPGRRGGRGPSNPPHCLAEPFPQREGSVRRRAPNTYWGLGPGQRARIASLRRWPQSVPETKAQSRGVWSGRPAQRQLQGGELLHAALRVWGAPAPKLCESQSSFSRDVSCCDLTPGRPGSTQVAASSPTGQAGLSHLRTVPNKKQAPSLGDRSAQLAPCLPCLPADKGR